MVATPWGGGFGVTQGAVLPLGFGNLSEGNVMAQERLPMRKIKKVGLLKNPASGLDLWGVRRNQWFGCPMVSWVQSSSKSA